MIGSPETHPQTPGAESQWFSLITPPSCQRPSLSPLEKKGNLASNQMLSFLIKMVRLRERGTPWGGGWEGGYVSQPN